jgi:hypothetical protein
MDLRGGKEGGGRLWTPVDGVEAQRWGRGAAVVVHKDETRVWEEIGQPRRRG